MKIKQAQQNKEIPEVDVIEDMRDPTKPLFLPIGEPNAKPSSFASVLDEDESGKKSHRKKDGGRKSRRDDEGAPMMKTAGHVTNPSPFAFDVPSPDDIVFNARKGTSLANARIKSGSPTTSLVHKKGQGSSQKKQAILSLEQRNQITELFKFSQTLEVGSILLSHIFEIGSNLLKLYLQLQRRKPSLLLDHSQTNKRASIPTQQLFCG